MEICLIFYSSNSKTKITFLGGIHEIGGNKFLVEDKGKSSFITSQGKSSSSSSLQGRSA